MAIAGNPRMTVPPMVPLGASLDVPSLVVLEGPEPWRGVRIRLDARHPMAKQVPARGYLRVGGDGDVQLPHIEPFMMIETRDGEFVTDAPGGFEKSGDKRAVLVPYATLEVGPYLFMYVPPTVDGLGIPPIYGALSVGKAQPLGVPSLLVKAGYARVLERKIPLVDDVLTVGGSLHAHVPLFRLPVDVAARLTLGASDLSYFVEPLDERCVVSVSGPHAARRILTPLASLLVDDWELTLLPPTKGVP
ncbi:MAG: hypothetical protein IPM79_31315 [Polyangiaceae bacterium]|jgi:hypothetical protein|nr:hypothetical protein [Polyangiaceae bacterium]MBK8941974.1 hypothetical protein [Polyangiaceae bacterium]